MTGGTRRREQYQTFEDCMNQLKSRNHSSVPIFSYSTSGFFWYTLHIGTLYTGFCMVITVWYNRTHVSRHMCDAFTHTHLRSQSTRSMPTSNVKYPSYRHGMRLFRPFIKCKLTRQRELVHNYG